MIHAIVLGGVFGVAAGTLSFLFWMRAQRRSIGNAFDAGYKLGVKHGKELRDVELVQARLQASRQAIQMALATIQSGVQA